MEFAYKEKPVSCKRLGYKLWAAEKEKNQSSESKNGTQTGISKDDSQVQTDNNKTSEKPSDEVSDQNKNVGANNEQ